MKGGGQECEETEVNYRWWKVECGLVEKEKGDGGKRLVNYYSNTFVCNFTAYKLQLL